MLYVYPERERAIDLFDSIPTIAPPAQKIIVYSSFSSSTPATSLFISENFSLIFSSTVALVDERFSFVCHCV
jgi:hypothetical protein